MNEYNPKSYESISVLPVAEVTGIVARAENFDDLITRLDALGRVKRSDGEVVGTDEIISWIESVRRAESTIHAITRQFGLREKVLELFAAEQIEQATSIAELVQAVQIIVAMKGEPITSSGGESIPTEELIAAIESDNFSPLLVTRTFGLRDKAVALKAST